MYNGEYKELTGLMIFLLRLWKGDQEYIPCHPECRKKLPSLLSKGGTSLSKETFFIQNPRPLRSRCLPLVVFQPSVVLALWELSNWLTALSLISFSLSPPTQKVMEKQGSNRQVERNAGQSRNNQTGPAPQIGWPTCPGFPGDFLSFRIGSPTSWETPQSQTNQDGWSPYLRWE